MSSVTNYISSWWYGNTNVAATSGGAAADNSMSNGSTAVGCKPELSEKEDEDFMVIEHIKATDAKATSKAKDILKPTESAKGKKNNRAKPGTNVVAVTANFVERRTYQKPPSKKSRDRQLAKALFADVDADKQVKPSVVKSIRSHHATPSTPSQLN